MPVEMKKPAKLRYPWPPLDADYRREVTLQDNWASLAAQVGRTDAWDIIQYNFDTKDPHEVNWYLANWVGCTVASADGKNLRFGTGAPGKQLFIYIPHPGWFPGASPHDAAAGAVFKVLNSQQAYRIGFNLDGMTMQPREMEVVVNNLISRRVGVRLDPTLPCTARYRAFDADGQPGDVILVKQAVFGTILAESLLIHEAIHALDDIQGRRTTRIKREAKAYIAQLLYMRYRQGPSQIANPVYGAADAIAYSLGVHQPVKPEKVAKLYAAIQASPPDQFGEGVVQFNGT